MNAIYIVTFFIPSEERKQIFVWRNCRVEMCWALTALLLYRKAANWTRNNLLSP
jgi:hypothetical protein